MKITIIGSLLILLTACAGISPQRYNEIMTAKVKERAAFDFQCKKENITVQKIGITSFGAIGCGKKASYVGITGKCTSTYESHVEDYCEIASDNFDPNQSKPK